MGSLHEWKKKAASEMLSAPQPEKTIRRQLAAAAGAEQFQNRDPVWHITEDFRRTFDLMGSAAAQKRAESTDQDILGQGMRDVAAGIIEGPGMQETQGMQDVENRRSPDEEKTGNGVREGLRERLLGRSDMNGLVEPGVDSSRMFLSRFSELAFNRGTLSGAVLRGTGKMMLFSCLKRTIGQSQPKNLRQRMLFEGGSARRNINGSSPDQVMFNRGQVDGAVGIVVDVLRDSRRTVESMEKLASGRNQLTAGSGAETLLKLYPFLSDEKEQQLLGVYREKLSALTNAESGDTRAALQNAIVKAEALIQKKAQMKVNFITALRGIQDRATEALEMFSQPGFTEELYGELTAEDNPEPPEDKGDGDGKNGQKQKERT